MPAPVNATCCFTTHSAATNGVAAAVDGVGVAGGDAASAFEALFQQLAGKQRLDAGMLSFDALAAPSGEADPSARADDEFAVPLLDALGLMSMMLPAQPAAGNTEAAIADVTTVDAAVVGAFAATATADATLPAQPVMGGTQATDAATVIALTGMASPVQLAAGDMGAAATAAAVGAVAANVPRVAGITTAAPLPAATEPAITAAVENVGYEAAQALVSSEAQNAAVLSSHDRPQEKAANEPAMSPAEVVAAGKEASRTLGAAAAVTPTPLQAVVVQHVDQPAVQSIMQPAAHHMAATVLPASRELPVAAAVGAPGWGDEIGSRIVWMASRAESRAELVLTPPQMGRVEVSLTVSGDQASALFASSNPVVREALEAALPRLREALADAGIQLGQAQVGAENARQSAQQERSGDNRGIDRGAGIAALQAGSVTQPVTGLKIGRGLVDVFA